VVSSGAAPTLRALVERLRIPVVTSVQGRGSLPEDHPLCMGPLATSPTVRSVIEDADVVLAIGTRFQMYPTGFWQVRLPGLIHVDADASVIGRSYPADVAIVGDAALVLEELNARVTHTQADTTWASRASEAGRVARTDAMESLGPDHRAIVNVIRRHLPRGGAIVRDATVPAYNWGDRLLPILEPRTSMHPVSAAIGPGLPIAMGATIGRGERSVVIHGDGGIMLTIGELATLAQFSVPLTVCVFNDRGYGILRGIQAATCDGAQNDVDLVTPDFVALAAAMGVPGEAVKDVEGFESAFRTSVSADGPYLIEIDLTALAPMDIPIGGQEMLA
jgi:acetolactate synthase-1/2/3 large subunit